MGDVGSRSKASPRLRTKPAIDQPRVLLIGPYDPHCGEYTFLAPPLGVWRLQGFLQAHGIDATVYDPNLRPEDLDIELADILLDGHWDVIGVSTTGMTLPFDLDLAHRARLARPDAVLVAGGMEATFRTELMFELGPFDLVVLGEGENPLLALCERLRQGAARDGIPGTALRRADGGVQRFPARAMSAAALRDSIFAIPYQRMPYGDYWARLETAYRVGGLPYKADREAKLAEIRSVRLITLNYCPMGCTFCSSTNFLHAAQGSIAGIARLDAADCLTMIERIVAAHPTVRTIIFQDDIFVFTSDKRVLALCDAIVAAKKRGSIPRHLQFISTNRIDAMTSERLTAMRSAGFRVLGFGIENFSRDVLTEFNKKSIFPHIEPMLAESLRLGMTPFLDIILTSPRAVLADLAETVRQSYRWILEGCEIGLYPYVIPFSGAAMTNDAALMAHADYETRRVSGTNIEWQQPIRILPLDGDARTAILAIEQQFQSRMAQLRSVHLPSRARSLLWIECAIPILVKLGQAMPDGAMVARELARRLPALHSPPTRSTSRASAEDRRAGVLALAAPHG